MDANTPANNSGNAAAGAPAPTVTGPTGPIDTAKVGRLGFGMMRLPRRAGRIDVTQVSAMVDAFLDAGFNYFDTAFVYPGSEQATRRALIERHPRDSFTIATKLFATAVPSAKLARRELGTSLKRLGTDHVDFYLLHAIMESNADKYERFGLWDFVAGERERGTVRHMGFSFHGGPELLERLLTEHPEVEFVQLQINYADWESPTVQSRENLEVACAHGKPVVVMEPVKGGRLANPPESVREVLDACVAEEGLSPAPSYASWAVRFAATLPGVMCVLSGMSDAAQVADNLTTVRNLRPFDERERRALRAAMEALGQVGQIPCTACGYCLEGCPQQIKIPKVFEAANELALGDTERARKALDEAMAEGGDPATCLACGACERVCPQHIGIVDELARAREALAEV